MKVEVDNVGFLRMPACSIGESRCRVFPPLGSRAGAARESECGENHTRERTRSSTSLVLVDNQLLSEGFRDCLSSLKAAVASASAADGDDVHAIV